MFAQTFLEYSMNVTVPIGIDPEVVINSIKEDSSGAIEVETV